jgi:protoheme IX farnesyltransferase
MSNSASTQAEYIVHQSSTSYSWREALRALKPVVALLVIITAFPSMILATNEFPSFTKVLAVTIGIFLTSAAGSIINQVIDYDIDSKMMRTNERLIPSLKLNRWSAFAIGLAFLTIGCFVLYFFASPLAATIALIADLFYLLVYTMYLKRRTAQNIVIGGAAGAVGPLIGWAAVEPKLSLLPWLMFALIFFWTPPHFWALAIKYRDDYAAAKVPMLPVVASESSTKLQMLIYALVMVPVTFGIFYLSESYMSTNFFMTGLTAWFCWMCFKLWKSPDGTDPMPVFQFSCIYLFLIFFGLTIEQSAKIIW